MTAGDDDEGCSGRTEGPDIDALKAAMDHVQCVELGRELTDGISSAWAYRVLAALAAAGWVVVPADRVRPVVDIEQVTTNAPSRTF